MEYDEFQAMNTIIQVAMEGEPDLTGEGFEIARQFVADSEQRFSRFRKDSELTALNNSSGSWFEASSNLFELVQESLELYSLTDGLFDPSILPALIAAGYDRSFDEIHPTSVIPTHSASRMKRSDLENIRTDRVNQAIRLPAGLMLDLGGVAKGWIAAQAVRRLEQYCSACAVSAGGDLALSGLPIGEPDWKIALEDPRDPQQVLAVLKSGPGALATSSVTKRRWMQAGQEHHHIIDPRNWLPADPAWLSVTVWAQKATLAEAFAKSLLIAGPQEAPSLAARIPGLRFIAVDPHGSLWGSHESKEMICDVTATIF